MVLVIFIVTLMTVTIGAPMRQKDGHDGSPAQSGRRVPANTCHARAVFATRLSTM